MERRSFLKLTGVGLAAVALYSTVPIILTPSDSSYIDTAFVYKLGFTSRQAHCTSMFKDPGESFIIEAVSPMEQGQIIEIWREDGELRPYTIGRTYS